MFVGLVGRDEVRRWALLPDSLCCQKCYHLVSLGLVLFGWEQSTAKAPAVAPSSFGIPVSFKVRVRGTGYGLRVTGNGMDNSKGTDEREGKGKIKSEGKGKGADKKKSHY